MRNVNCTCAHQTEDGMKRLGQRDDGGVDKAYATAGEPRLEPSGLMGDNGSLLIIACVATTLLASSTAGALLIVYCCRRRQANKQMARNGPPNGQERCDSPWKELSDELDDHHMAPFLLSAGGLELGYCECDLPPPNMSTMYTMSASLCFDNEIGKCLCVNQSNVNPPEH